MHPYTGAVTSHVFLANGWLLYDKGAPSCMVLGQLAQYATSVTIWLQPRPTRVLAVDRMLAAVNIACFFARYSRKTPWKHGSCLLMVLGFKLADFCVARGNDCTVWYTLWHLNLLTNIRLILREKPTLSLGAFSVQYALAWRMHRRSRAVAARLPTSEDWPVEGHNPR